MNNYINLVNSKTVVYSGVNSNLLNNELVNLEI